MLRPLAWMLGGIVLALLGALAIMPTDALGAIVPLLGIVVVGVAITVVAGVRGRRLDGARRPSGKED